MTHTHTYTPPDEGKPLPFPPDPSNLGDVLSMLLAVSPMQRDRYVRTLLDQVSTISLMYIYVHVSIYFSQNPTTRTKCVSASDRFYGALALHL